MSVATLLAGSNSDLCSADKQHHISFLRMRSRQGRWLTPAINVWPRNISGSRIRSLPLGKDNMRSRFALFLLAVSLALFAAPAALAQAQTGDTSTLMKLESEFQKATAEKGWDGYASYFAEDGVELPNGESAVKGKQAVRKSLGDWTPGMSLTWTPAGAGMAASGDLGYTYGEYTLKSKDKDGHPVVRYGKYMTVWKKQKDGSWKVAADMGNNAPPHEAQ
jgi:ketosteroid isomerase-like protein